MPLGSNLATRTPGVHSFHRLTVGKYSKVSISKASRRIVIKLHTQHHWAEERLHLVFGQIGLELWLPLQHIHYKYKMSGNSASIYVTS